MKRTTLAFASLAVATVACLTVMRALREPRVEAASASAAGAPAPPEASPSMGLAEGADEPPGPTPPAPAPDAAARVRAAEAEEQALRDALLHVGKDASLPLETRLERYREALQAARVSTPDAPLLASPSLLAEVFLRMESVQRELAAQSPAARARTLAHIRRELGFDEDAIARMEAIDERREARWQNGIAYMNERARVAASFEGDALEAELGALRENYFGDEAPTIAAEEQQGFFRFERPRIYGRN